MPKLASTQRLSYKTKIAKTMRKSTLDLPSLRKNFNQNGYLKVEQLYSLSEMADINDALDKFLLHGVEKMPPEQVYYETPNERSSIKQLQKLFEYDDFFRSLIFDGPTRMLAEFVLNEPVRPVNMQFFNKPPGIGKATPPHQDGFFFHLTPPKAVTGWLALEPVDDENGCINYVRGSHKADDLSATANIRHFFCNWIPSNNSKTAIRFQNRLKHNPVTSLKNMKWQVLLRKKHNLRQWEKW